MIRGVEVQKIEQTFEAITLEGGYVGRVVHETAARLGLYDHEVNEVIDAARKAGRLLSDTAPLFG